MSSPTTTVKAEPGAEDTPAKPGGGLPNSKEKLLSGDVDMNKNGEEEKEPRNYFECRIKDQALFKTLLQCSLGILDGEKDENKTITLRIRKNYIIYFGIDSNHVALAGPEAFEMFQFESANAPPKEAVEDEEGHAKRSAEADDIDPDEAEQFEISLDLNMLNKVLKICKARDQIYLLHDANDSPDHLTVSLMDVRSEKANAGDGNEPDAMAIEGGAVAAKGRKKKATTSAAADLSGPKQAMFKLQLRPLGNDSQLALPPKKPDATQVRMSCALFRYVQDCLMELAVQNQKTATILIQCPREELMDTKNGNQKVEADILRFGSENQTGTMACEFVVAGTLEQQLELTVEESVFLTRGESFGTDDKCRFTNKFISKISTGLSVAEHVKLFLSAGYPFIAELPLSNDAGLLSWVVSPRLEDEEDGVGDGDGNAMKNEPDDDLFAEEDEFSDG
eukprot:CAMPEP_0178989530 /NCGR_PEP_ID=MMETSP0795-20121207/4429_1 /TAXON_ID=88552 /ORGANISM="Amoebophrya sp., Strain Ameob2" /LENGTH=448 /DNA_ID=CAMNT_0020680949 /DNA_START=54 /DNA_END=1400 /DNA_ORIENTATION=+